MQSLAGTVAEYLATLPPDRRGAIEAVRSVILENLDRDFEEGMAYGMIGYGVPLRVFPRGYHCAPPSRPQPLPFAGLASQKNHMTLYLMTCYGEGPQVERFRREWAKSGKKLDMGKCCIRFRKLEDLALDVIGRTIRGITAKEYVENYQATLAAPEKRKSAGRRTAAPAGKKAAARKKAPAGKKAATGKSALARTGGGGNARATRAPRAKAAAAKRRRG